MVSIPPRGCLKPKKNPEGRCRASGRVVIIETSRSLPGPEIAITALPAASACRPLSAAAVRTA